MFVKKLLVRNLQFFKKKKSYFVSEKTKVSDETQFLNWLISSCISCLRLKKSKVTFGWPPSFIFQKCSVVCKITNFDIEIFLLNGLH